MVEKNADAEQEETDGPGGDAEGTTMTVLEEYSSSLQLLPL